MKYGGEPTAKMLRIIFSKCVQIGDLLTGNYFSTFFFFGFWGFDIGIEEWP